MGFLTRWFFAFALVVITFNPTPYNYVDWVMTYGQQNLSIAVLIGLLLFVSYIIFLRATVQSIGIFGMLLVLAILGATGWVLYDFGILRLGNSDFSLWLGLIACSIVLGVGLGWSHVRRKMTGQVDVDDVDD